MKQFKSIACALALSFVATAVYSQEPVQALLVNYINSVNTLGDATHKEDVLNLFHENYKNNTAYVKMSGIVSRTSTGKGELASTLEETLQNANYKFRLTLDKILYVAQRDRAGTISALVNFQSTIDDKLAEKGTLLMNIVGITMGGEWKIIHNNTVRVSEASDVGNCVCYIYAKGATKFITEVYYPSGVEYGQNFESFRVTSRDGNRIITSDKNDFIWDPEGNLSYEGNTIGTTDDPKEAIQISINELYKESCTKVLFN